MGGIGSKNAPAAAAAGPSAQKPEDTESAIRNYFENNDFKKNMEKLSGLVDKYNEGDLDRLFKSIINDYGLDENDKQSLIKVVDPHVKYLQKIGYADIQTAFKNNKLYQGFLNKYNKRIEDSEDFKESLKQFPMFANDIKKFVSGVTNISSREQFFKFHYLYSQIWIIMYIKTIRSAIEQYTSTSIDIFNKIEVTRTKNTQVLLERLLALIATDNNALDEKDFLFFKSSLDKLKTKIQEDVGRSESELKEAYKTMSDTLTTSGEGVGGLTQNTLRTRSDTRPSSGFSGQSFRQGASSQGANSQGASSQGANSQGANSQGANSQLRSQQGGFVRDGSRFPEAFFAEPTKTFDQFGGQSFQELDKQ